MSEYLLLDPLSVCIDTHQNRLNLSDEIANAAEDKVGATPGKNSPYDGVSFDRLKQERKDAINRLLVKQANKLGGVIDKMLRPSQAELRERGKCLSGPQEGALTINAKTKKKTTGNSGSSG